MGLYRVMEGYIGLRGVMWGYRMGLYRFRSPI